MMLFRSYCQECKMMRLMEERVEPAHHQWRETVSGRVVMADCRACRRPKRVVRGPKRLPEASREQILSLRRLNPTTDRGMEVSGG